MICPSRCDLSATVEYASMVPMDVTCTGTLLRTTVVAVTGTVGAGACRATFLSAHAVIRKIAATVMAAVAHWRILDGWLTVPLSSLILLRRPLILLRRSLILLRQPLICFA